MNAGLPSRCEYPMDSVPGLCFMRAPCRRRWHARGYAHLRATIPVCRQG